MNNITGVQNIDNSRYFINTHSGFSEKTPFSINSEKTNSQELSINKKAVITLTSALGMVLPLLYWCSKAGFSINPSRILKTPIKEWALFKYKPVDKILKYDNWKPIVTTAIGSVAGGFAGGIIVDKENTRAKKREVLNQLLGDVIVPIGCVFIGAKVFQKYEHKLKLLMPKIENDIKIFGKKFIKNSKFVNTINLISENIPNAVATIFSLGVGIIAGNKVSNEINERLYKKKVERGIRATDFAPHVDDLCMAISMVNKGSSLGAKLGRFIPLALLVPGYETGTAREN